MSDYGFENVISEQNVLKFKNTTLILSGIVMCTSCALSLALKLDKNREPRGLFVEASANSNILRNFDKETQSAIFTKSLLRKGLSHDTLVSAATHLAPIESQLLELADLFRILGALKYPISQERLAHISESIRLGSLLRDVFRAVPEKVCTSSESIMEYLSDTLLDVWTSRGYFSSKSYPNPEAFGNRQTSEAIGVDIGSTVKTALSGNDIDHQLSVDAIRAGLIPLQQFGFVLVKRAVNENLIFDMQKLFKINGQPSGEIGSAILSYDANISHSRASANRLQLVLRGSKIEELTAAVHTALVPLVTAYYDRKGITSRVLLSDLRIVVVDHAAHPLPWTAYNSQGGLSVMIPLQSHDSRSGSQRFLPGSHILLDRKVNLLRRMSMFFERYRLFKRPINITDLYTDGTWKAGDAFVFDNRLLVRGGENALFRSGTYLLAKYETVDESPKAVYFGGKVWFRLAQFLETLAPYCAIL